MGHYECSGHIECVRLLLDGGADNDVLSNTGITALMLAILHDHIDCARLLVEAGADKQIAGDDGVTALARAQSRGPEQRCRRRRGGKRGRGVQSRSTGHSAMIDLLAADLFEGEDESEYGVVVDDTMAIAFSLCDILPSAHAFSLL